MSLWADFLTNDQRVIHKWTHYFPIYERHFARYVNRPLKFIEIGCGQGGSLQMWKRYFGPYAEIVGLDIRPEAAQFEESQIAVRIGDQANPDFLFSVIEEFGTPDIILDDGSHRMTDIRASFDCLYHNVDHNGVYMVEDLHTAYWPAWEGGLRKEGTFIEMCKGLIDDLNADHIPLDGVDKEFAHSTISMHFYDSIVAFERGRHLPKHAPQIGRP